MKKAARVLCAVFPLTLLTAALALAQSQRVVSAEEQPAVRLSSPQAALRIESTSSAILSAYKKSLANPEVSRITGQVISERLNSSTLLGFVDGYWAFAIDTTSVFGAPAVAGQLEEELRKNGIFAELVQREVPHDLTAGIVFVPDLVADRLGLGGLDRIRGEIDDFRGMMEDIVRGARNEVIGVDDIILGLAITIGWELGKEVQIVDVLVAALEEQGVPIRWPNDDDEEEEEEGEEGDENGEEEGETEVVDPCIVIAACASMQVQSFPTLAITTITREEARSAWGSARLAYSRLRSASSSQLVSVGSLAPGVDLRVFFNS